MSQIIGSVGLGGKNRPVDVLAVQRLLLQAGVSPGPIDQRCGVQTIRAIEHFQQGFLRRPDGRVDVGGPTWRHLQQAAQAHAQRRAHPISAPKQPHSSAVLPPITRHQPAPALGSAHPAAGAAARPPAHAPSTPISPNRPDPASYWQKTTELMPFSQVNQGLQSPPNSLLISLLGQPTGAKTEGLIVTAHAGPLHVTGLRPAVDSLAAIMTKVHHDLPDLYGLISTSGMRAVRSVRGRHNWSNHSWGIAIDLKIGSVLVPLGAHYSIKGIDALVPYFNDAGWYWGGGYHKRKDPMHFECSSSLLRSFSL